MGMIASYMRIQEEVLRHLMQHPDEIEDFLWQEEGDELICDIDKAWHGIYFLLTGEADWEKPIPSLEGLAIFGGTEIGDDLGYGPARYLWPDEVQHIAKALEAISAEEMASRYNAAEMNQHGLYPLEDEWTEDDRDYIVEHYKQLSEYFQTAARRGEAMLLFIS